MENRRAIEARQQSLHAELVAARQARPTSLEVLPHNYDDYTYDDYSFTYYITTMIMITLSVRRWTTRAACSSKL